MKNYLQKPGIIATALLVMNLLVVAVSFGQTATNGDYRTRSTGALNWDGAATWQVRTAGSWANTSTPPTAAANVYIQSGSTVTVNVATADCKDLQIHTGGVITIGTNTLQVSGKIRGYTGTAVFTTGADGTFYSGQTNNATLAAAMLTSTGAGKLKFIGTTRNITNTGEWGASNTTGFATEFALTAGNTGTLQTGYKTASVTISSGTINMGTNRLAPDNGTSGQGDVTIASGATLISAATGTGTPVMSRTTTASTGRAGTFTLNGNLLLGGAAPYIEFTTLAINPGSTIEFTAGTQSLLQTTFTGAAAITSYANLVTSAAGTKTVPVSITVASLDNGGPSNVASVFNMAGNTLTATSIDNTGATIRFSGASNGVAVSTGTVDYFGTTQTVATGTYATLNITASGTKTAGGDITATTLDNGGASNAASILDMGANTLTATTLENTSATVRFSGAANGLAISAGTVEYNGSTQTVASGNYQNLIISNAGEKSLSGTTSLTGTLTINTLATLSQTTAVTMSVTGNVTITGTFTQSAGTFSTTGNVTVNGTVNQSGTGLIDLNTKDLKISAGGNFNQTGGTTSAKGLNRIDPGGTYTQSGATSLLKLSETTAGDIRVDAGGTFISSGGTVEIFGKTGGNAFNSPGSVTFFNLTFSGTVREFTDPASINIKGDFLNNLAVGPTYTGTTTFTFNGSSPQTISSAAGVNPTFTNVVLNNSAGVSLSTSVTMSGTLTLTNGVVSTGANTLTLTLTNAIPGGGSASSYINGNLRRAVAAGNSTVVFPIGNTTHYTPASLAFTGVTGAGSVTLSAVAGLAAVPGNATLGLSTSNGINRYWSASNNTTTGGSYVGTYTYINGSPIDNLGTFTTSQLRTGIYNGSTWSYPGQVTASTSTTVTAPSTSGFGTVVFAAQRVITATLSGTPTKPYDGTNTAPLGSISVSLPGVVSPDVVTASGISALYDDKNVAGSPTKEVTVSGLSLGGANADNYLLSSTTASANIGTITALSITASITGSITKTFDGNATAALTSTDYTLSSVIFPDDVTVTNTSGSYDNKNITGSPTKTVTVTSLVLGGADAGNYALSNAASVSGNVGTINALGITVTPDPGQLKVFGNTDPVFTYTNSPALIAPDVFTGALGRNAGEAIGFYSYTLGSLSAGGNYSLSLGGSNTFEIQAIGQANADFRSQATGNFSAAATWEYDLGGGNWQNATQAPGINNNVSISHAVTLDQNFTVGAAKSFTLASGGSFTVNSDQTLTVSGSANFGGQLVTFKSDATGYGSLGQVTGSLTGATNVTVERFIPNVGFRSWRLLSVPTSGSQTIRQSWQENNTPLANTVPGYGTLITGGGNNTGASQALGFDFSGPNTSMLFWNNTTWGNISGTLGALSTHQAYFLYVRGDRSKGVTGQVTDAGSTTLRSNGSIYTGNQVISAPNTYSLIPNLYPSAINFTGLTRSGVANNYTIWDSKTQVGNQLGRYVTFSGTNGWEPNIGTVSYPANVANTTIESGQAFFVNGGAGATITLVETAKTNASANGNLGMRPVKRERLVTALQTAEGIVLDGNTVVFDAAFANEVDAADAQKMGNPGANFGVETAGKILAVEGRKPAAELDAVQFRMWNLSTGNYTLKLEAGNIAPAGMEAVLEDRYTKTVTPVLLNGSTTVNFTISADAASQAANRFRVVFRKNAAGSDAVPAISIAPNPVEHDLFSIRLTGSTKGKYTIVVRTTDGKQWAAYTLQHEGGTTLRQLALPANTASGIYQLESMGPDRTRTNTRLFVLKR